jgi:tellurite resistance protein
MALLVPEGLKDASEDKLCAILEVMYYMAKSDGVFSHEELVHFLRVAEAISGGRITPAQVAIFVSEWSSEMTCHLAAQLAEVDDAVLAPEKHMLDFLGRTFFPQGQ